MITLATFKALSTCRAGLNYCNVASYSRSFHHKPELLVMGKKKKASTMAPELFSRVTSLCRGLSVVEEGLRPFMRRPCDVCVRLQTEICTSNPSTSEGNSFLRAVLKLEQIPQLFATGDDSEAIK
jgi:hypothetical protein